MKHLIQKLIPVIKTLFFFFRVIMTLGIGRSAGKHDSSDQHESGKD